MGGWGFCPEKDAEKFLMPQEYSRSSNRAIDFYEPLHQAEAALDETAEGVLAVDLLTFELNFNAFLAWINEGE
ncbi:MAG: hypothetical protein ACUVV5_11905 [Candidatus Aminicenantales bacterium]